MDQDTEQLATSTTHRTFTKGKVPALTQPEHYRAVGYCDQLALASIRDHHHQVVKVDGKKEFCSPFT